MALIIEKVLGTVITRAVYFETIEAESLIVGAVPVRLTKVNPGIVRAVLSLEAGDIRWQTKPNWAVTKDGEEGSPLLRPGEILVLLGRNNIRNVRFIQAGKKPGRLRVLLEREER